MRLNTSTQQRVACSAEASCPRVYVRSSPNRLWSSSAHVSRTVLVSAGNRQLQTDAVPQAVQAADRQARVASVQVDVGYAVEQVNVELKHPESYLLQAAVSFPLGVVFEDVAGSTQVTEVTPGGAAEGAGVRVGDVLVATTAMVMQMTYPTMNLMFGGVGRPKLVKALVRCSALPFSKAMDAIRSNTTTAGGDGGITLVLERRGVQAVAAAVGAGTDGLSEQPGAVSSSSTTSPGPPSADSGTAAADTAKDGQTGGTVFDPALFD